MDRVNYFFNIQIKSSYDRALGNRIAKFSANLNVSDKRRKSLCVVCVVSALVIIAVFVLVIIISLSVRHGGQRKRDYPTEMDTTTTITVTVQNKTGQFVFDALNKECLVAHNHYRKLHRVPDLKLDKKLIAFAKERAHYLVTTDVFEHAKDLRGNGENLHFIAPYKQYECDRVMKAFYSEIKDYNYQKPWPSKKMVGHFTQLVWKSTTNVGCAQAYSARTKRCYTVCNYFPPGNYVDKFKSNVLPAKKF